MGWLFGRAGDQGLFMGMLSPRAPKEEADAFVAKAICQQQRQGALGRALWRAWPLAVIALAVAVWLIVARN